MVFCSLAELLLVSLPAFSHTSTVGFKKLSSCIGAFPGFPILTVTLTVTWATTPDARSMLTTHQCPPRSSFVGSSSSPRLQKQRYASHLPTQSSVQYVLAIGQASLPKSSSLAELCRGYVRSRCHAIAATRDSCGMQSSHSIHSFEKSDRHRMPAEAI